MIPLKREIWKITIAQIFILLVCVIAIRHEGIQVASDIVHKSFAAKADSKDHPIAMSLLETLAVKVDDELG